MKASFASALLAALLILAAGCSTAPTTQQDRDALHTDVLATVINFKAADAGLEDYFDSASGYAVFPSIGKGAVGVGGAYGKGELFEGGRMTGYCDMSQGTIGFQLGGQAYSELIFFENPDALENFKSGDFAFAAQASAVAATAGASTDANYENGSHGFHAGEGWSHVRGLHRRPELSLPGQVVSRVVCAGPRVQRRGARAVQRMMGRVLEWRCTSLNPAFPKALGVPVHRNTSGALVEYGITG